MDIVIKIIFTLLAAVIIFLPFGDIPPLVRKSRRSMAVPRAYWLAMRVGRVVVGVIILVGVWIFPEWRSHFIRAAILFSAAVTLLINRICLGVWY